MPSPCTRPLGVVNHLLDAMDYSLAVERDLLNCSICCLVTCVDHECFIDVYRLKPSKSRLPLSIMMVVAPAPAALGVPPGTPRFGGALRKEVDFNKPKEGHQEKVGWTQFWRIDCW